MAALRSDATPRVVSGPVAPLVDTTRTFRTPPSRGRRRGDRPSVEPYAICHPCRVASTSKIRYEAHEGALSVTAVLEPPAQVQVGHPRSAQPLRADVAPQAGPTQLPTVDGGWKTILADPPWRFTNRTGKVAPEHRRLDRYDTMTLPEICALPVVDVAADNSHLYLWCPSSLLPEGLQVMQAWGYRYVTLLVWAKRRKDGGPDGRGVGFYFRNVFEIGRAHV